MSARRRDGDLEKSIVTDVPEAKVVAIVSDSDGLPPYEQQTQFTEDQVLELKDKGFSGGLIKTLLSTKAEFPLRIWVVDNSGSMMWGDGSRLIQNEGTGNIRVEQSSRWAELQDCIKYHVEFAALTQAPSRFCLLNPPGADVGKENQFFSVGTLSNTRKQLDDDVQNAKNIMDKGSCWGKTPLTEHVRKIKRSLSIMSPQLNGRRVAVIIATDGLPSEPGDFDQDTACRNFITSLRELEPYPVWLVIRLCTSNTGIVDFYQSLDNELEMPVELLDDFVSEGREIYRVNKWLNYALPLHRCRELGLKHRIFDLIDERPLTKDQLRECCAFLFGIEKNDIPDPHVNWSLFTKEINRLMEQEKKHWNPATSEVSPWIDMKELERCYGAGAGCQCTIL